MSCTSRLLLAASLLSTLASPLLGAIVIPGADGSDGPLTITTNTVIDLRRAVTGTWDTNNTAHAGNGVYDPTKWAIVFKYTEVNIAPGVSLTFLNHPSRAPVVWLVSGNVDIAGSVNLDGQTMQSPPLLAEPGPGGFRGGNGQFAGGVGAGAGFGPAGGAISTPAGAWDPANPQANPTGQYGNPSLLPLIGGSGGGGVGENPGGPAVSGGAGGGAILIAATQELRLDGQISANGGNGTRYGWGFANYYVGGGAGGSIRLIADVLQGAGLAVARGGTFESIGAVGRVRIERVLNESSMSVVPDPSVIDLAAGATPLIWPPADSPEVRIVSIGGVDAPSDPKAGFGTIGADVALPATNSAEVLIETINVESASEVKVRGTPRSNGNYTEARAEVVGTLSEKPLVLRWKAPLPTSIGYSAVQVLVVRP